ncbi:MAG: hypothetical protein U1D55_05800 [Phycisphaerae bacterium]
MAVVARSPQPIPANVFWRDLVQQAQGETGRKLRARAEEAFEHWTRRTEILVRADDADEFSYVSVPPNRTFWVKTRYVFRGKGKPLPIRVDEE